MKKFIPFALIAVCGTAIFAEESSLAKEAAEQKSSMEYSVTTSGAYYLEADHKTGSSHFSGVSGPYDGVEAVTEFDATYTMPFLNGDDDLTADNHLALKLGLELSPVTVAPVASVTFSPIAFLEICRGRYCRHWLEYQRLTCKVPQSLKIQNQARIQGLDALCTLVLVRLGKRLFYV